LKALRELCDQHGILLVADESSPVVGRTGKLWACEWEGVEPDIPVLRQGLGSGMPIARSSRRIGDDLESGSHGSTFGGNPVCIAAALAPWISCRTRCLTCTPWGARAQILAEMQPHPVIGNIRDAA